MDTTEAPARRTSKRSTVPSASKDSRENSQTCARCRKNKLVCNSVRPRCSECVSTNVSCEYDEPARPTSTRAAPATTASTSRKRPAPPSTYAQIKESRQRKRAAAAQTSCDFCRNDLRRKCDGLRPSCQSCIKRGEPCVYSGPASIPVTASSSNISLPHTGRSDDEESDVAMPSRSHSPDVPLADSASPTTPLDPNRPRYPQGNGLGHAGSTRNPDGTNCTRPVACFFCIKVELPCTGDFPTCVNCVRRNLPCSYPDPSSYAHQFPRQSAMHTRQLKDGTQHRASTSSAAHTSPGRSQLPPSQPALHPSRSHPGPLNNQPGPTSPSISTSPESMAHNRQRSMSGPNGAPGFGSDVIRSSNAAMDNVPRSTAGARTTSNVSPVRLPASNAAHSRTSSTAASPGQPTLSNPIPLPAPRSTAQSPSTPIQTPNQTHNHLPSQNHNQPQTQNPPPAERVLDTVRGLPGDVRSPVNGVLVSPSGRTRDASLVHGPSGTHSRTGSTSQGDGFVHEGPASYRARMGEGDGTGTTNEAPHRNGVLPTISNRTPGRGSLNLAPTTRPPSGQEDESAANNANDVQRPDLAPNIETRADPISGSGAARAPNGTSRPTETRPGLSVVAEARTSAPVSNGSSRPSPAVATTPLPTAAAGSAPSSTAGPTPPTRTGTGPDLRPTSGITDPRPSPEDVRSSSNKPEETRPQSEEQRAPRVDEPRSRPINPLPLPDSLPRRPSVPSPITQHPARDLSIIAPMAAMGRQEISRRDSGDRNGRYDPRRDTGVRDDRRDNDRRDSGSNDRRGSTSGRGDPVNNWQPAPRSNTQPRPVPPLDTRGSNLATRRDRSPHTPRNHAVPLPALESRGGPTRERSPRSRSPRMLDRDDPNTMTPVRRAKRRSQSPRGIDKLYIRAEFGSIRSSPMDMDSS